jgi:hypothetical protein
MLPPVRRGNLRSMVQPISKPFIVLSVVSLCGLDALDH